LQILKFCICWQFCIQVLALVCMSPVLRNSIWFHFHCLITCFYHYGIGEYSTVHFSVTLQSKFWMNRSRIWLFVDNFGAWKKCNLGPRKSLKSAWILYFEFATNLAFSNQWVFAMSETEVFKYNFYNFYITKTILCILLKFVQLMLNKY